jgi:Peptidase family M23
LAKETARKVRLILQLAIQLGLPMLFCAWLWLSPIKNRLGLALQTASVLLSIIAMCEVGIWTLVPRWSMVLFAIFALAGAVKAIRQPPSHLGLWGWVQSCVSVVLLIAWGVIIGEAWRGHQPPAIASVQLAFPLKGGDLIIANGGSKLLLNAHQDTLDISVPRHRLWQGQSYGIDIAALRPVGITSDGFQPKDPKRYAIFGRPVHAPCSGTVTALRDGRRDLDVPYVDSKVMEGNHIILRCNGVEVVMAHLKRGSIRVQPGQQIEVGQHIAAAGNSGMSDEPHLHIHAQMPSTKRAPFSGPPVAMFFNGRFLARNDRI